MREEGGEVEGGGHLSMAVLLFWVEGMTRLRAPLNAEYMSGGCFDEMSSVARCWRVAWRCMGTWSGQRWGV